MKIFTDKEWNHLASKINWGQSALDARAIRIMNKPRDSKADCDD